jgi:hypothetical protein
MRKPLNPVINADIGKILVLRCMICDVRVEGFYAQFENGGVCSRICMLVQDAKPKYPDHPAEAFERQHNL